MNNSQSPAIKHALQQLGNELAALKGFVALLTSEQQALLNNDTDSLLNLSESKTQAANQLMEMGNRRRAALLGNSKDTMETWISSHAPGLQPQWNEIRKLAAQSQQLNVTNGELINSRMRNNQQALNVLYNSPKNSASLYGPNGQSNINSAGRHLGSV